MSGHPCPEPQPSMDFDRLVRIARGLLVEFGARDGSFGAFSGGKDSCVIKHIAEEAGLTGLPWVYSVTTIDPPEVVRFIHRTHPGVVWRRPKERFFRLLERNGAPTRTYRWCCRELKESFSPPDGGCLFVGVRASESPRRARRCKQIMYHAGRNFPIISPIFEWSDNDVWHYLRSRNVPWCELYDRGRRRIGCAGCPMSTRRVADLAEYPYLAHQWRAAMRTWWDTTRRREGTRLSRTFGTFEEYWTWYWSDEAMPDDPALAGELPCQLLWAT